MVPPIKLLIVAEGDVSRRSLCVLLERSDHLTVVGEAADSEAALRLAADLKPDIILVGVSLLGLSAMEVTRASLPAIESRE